MRPMQPDYYIRAIFDPEASVWISETNIPGLVIEADTLAEFESLAADLAPEMLAENADLHDVRVPVDFISRRELLIA